MHENFKLEILKCALGLLKFDATSVCDNLILLFLVTGNVIWCGRWMDGKFIHTFTNNDEYTDIKKCHEHDKSVVHTENFVVANKLDAVEKKIQ